MQFHLRKALTPSELAFHTPAGARRFAILNRLEREGQLLEVVRPVSERGPEFVDKDERIVFRWSGTFRLLVYRSEDQAQAFVERRARPIHAAWPVRPIEGGPPLGDAAQWFRCDPALEPPPFTFYPHTTEFGDHVRWRRGRLALELRMAQASDINLPGFIDLAQQIDAFEALKPPLRLDSRIPAPASERERLTALLRLDRLRYDPALVEFGGDTPEKYTWFNTSTPAQRVLQAGAHARDELHRLVVGWQRVAACRIRTFGPYRSNLTADFIVDASAEAAQRDLHAPPLELWDTQQLLPNAVTFGEETVTLRTTRRRSDALAWQEESIAWTHGAMKLVASVDGASHRTDWTVLPAFAEALEAAYQHSIVGAAAAPSCLVT